MQWEFGECCRNFMGFFVLGGDRGGSTQLQGGPLHPYKWSYINRYLRFIIPISGSYGHLLITGDRSHLERHVSFIELLLLNLTFDQGKRQLVASKITIESSIFLRIRVSYFFEGGSITSMKWTCWFIIFHLGQSQFGEELFLLVFFPSSSPKEPNQCIFFRPRWHLNLSYQPTLWAFAEHFLGG